MHSAAQFSVIVVSAPVNRASVCALSLACSRLGRPPTQAAYSQHGWWETRDCTVEGQCPREQNENDPTVYNPGKRCCLEPNGERMRSQTQHDALCRARLPEALARAPLDAAPCLSPPSAHLSDVHRFGQPRELL